MIAVCEEDEEVNECEWKDGKFVGCDEMKQHFRAVVNNVVRFMVANGEIGIYFCPFCGADIRKPEKKVCTQTSGCLSNWTCKTCCFYEPEPKQPTHEETLQRVKKELNIQIDTKISDMKKSIIWHMNYLYDSLESSEIPTEAT